MTHSIASPRTTPTPPLTRPSPVAPPPYPLVQDTTEDELNPDDMQNEDPEQYTVGVRSVATISKGHTKMLFSLVFTNAVWVEKASRRNRTSDSGPLQLSSGRV